MKKLLLIAAVLGLTVTAAAGQAKIKVLDKSAKKVPTWVGSSQTDYIVTQAFAADLETAKNQCLEDVRRQIIRAVAENVSSSSAGSIDQQVMNNEIVSFLDTFTSSYQTQSADVPFLKGISSSKVEAYYWEKQQNRDTKEIKYLYAIKYPFPSVELKQMVFQFEKRDKEIYDKFLVLDAGLDKVSSLEDIDRAIAELNPIISYFFDNTRKTAARALQQSYRNLYSNVSFRTISNKLGEYRFSLVLDGRVITTSQRITAKSDGATEITVEHHGDQIVVKYNYAGAEWDVENVMTLNVKIGGKSVPHNFSFYVKKAGVRVYPNGTAYLTAEEKSDTLLRNITVRIPIKSEHSAPMTVRSLTLDVPGLPEPIFLDYLNQTFDRKESTLNVTWLGSVAPLKGHGNKLNMLRGSMEVEIPGEGIDTKVDFSLPFRANW